MKRLMLLAALVIALATGAAFAAGRGTPAEAKAMMEKAVGFYLENGQDKAFAEFNNPEGKFVKDDLYIVVLSQEGAVLSHGRNKALIGKNMMNVTDADGKFFTKEMVEGAQAKGSGSLDYKWTNPETKKVEMKTSFYKKAKEVVILCGAYKN